MKPRTALGTFAPRASQCHPERKHKGNGLCTTCYSRERATRNRDGNRARSRAWYRDNREYAIESTKKWLRANRGKHRETVLRYRYGLTPEDEQALLERQGYVCPICGQPFDGRDKGKVACVDHDHVTGKVRGLLHFTCNAGLGSLGDSIDRLRAAIAYLEAQS